MALGKCAPLLAAPLLLLLHIGRLAAPALCVRVLLYRSSLPSFLQWDSRSPVGWTTPNGNSTWPGTEHSEAALGYLDGSLFVVGGERHWSTPSGRRSRSGTPLYNHHEDSPTRLVKEVPLSNGTAKPAQPLQVPRQWPNGGKGVTTAGNTRLAVCGSGRYASAGGETSCEVLQSRRIDADGHRWMFVRLQRRMCGKDSAATGGHVLGRSGIVVAGGRCRNDSTSDQVALLDLSTGSVHRLPSMRHARAGHSITALGDRLVVCGGEVDENRDSWMCEQLTLTPNSDGGLRMDAAGAVWQYVDDMPPNAGATVQPVVRVRHIVAVAPDRLMALTHDEHVFFWRPGAGWSDGPGLPYRANGAGVTVIHEE